MLGPIYTLRRLRLVADRKNAQIEAVYKAVECTVTEAGSKLGKIALRTKVKVLVHLYEDVINTTVKFALTLFM